MNTPESVHKSFLEAIEKYEINGSILLNMDDVDLQDEIKIESKLHRKSILAAIQELLKDGQKKNMNFWEYRSLNRQQTDYTVNLLSMAPRWAISNFSTIPEHARPQKALGEDHNSILAWLEWIFVPEYYIFLNRETILGGLPGFIPYALMAHLIGKVCAFFFVTLMAWIASRSLLIAVGALFTLVAIELAFNTGLTVLAYFFSAMLWPIIPWFLTDLILYATIYVTPVIRLNSLRSVT